MGKLYRTLPPALLLAYLSCAAALPAQSGSGSPPGEFLALPESKIYYQECGSSPEAVVLLHDGVLDSAVWDDVWPELCKKFHVVRYDRRGYGRSPASPAPYFETDDLVALLRHLKLERAAIVGSSHGGEISINFALAHPEMVEQLVLVGAVVGGMPYSAHFIERGEVFDKPLEKGDVAGAIAAARDDKYLIAPGNQAARNRMAALLTLSPQDLTHVPREIAPKPALPELHEIKVPTLLLVGDADIPDVHAHAGAIEAGIPRARRVVVSGVGHLMYLEKPKEFAELLCRFLEQNR
jgi:pimeloyl-ACP methyl ester carboxylesterase